MSADILATLDPGDSLDRDGTSRYVYLHVADGTSMPPELRGWLKGHGGWFLAKRRPQVWRLPAGHYVEFRQAAATHTPTYTVSKPQTAPSKSSRPMQECPNPECRTARRPGTTPCPMCGDERLPVDRPDDPDPADHTAARRPLRGLAGLLPDVKADDAPAARSPSAEP